MVCFPNSWILPTSEGFRPQKIDKLAKSRTANWFQPQCWSKCGNEGRSRVGQEGHRWDQTDSRELLHVLHAPRAVLQCGDPTECWLFYQSLCRGSTGGTQKKNPINKLSIREKVYEGQDGDAGSEIPVASSPVLCHWPSDPQLMSYTLKMLHSVQHQSHWTSCTRDGQGKDTWSGLRKFP